MIAKHGWGVPSAASAFWRAGTIAFAGALLAAGAVTGLAVYFAVAALYAIVARAE
jgi:hypothetical protein